MPLKIIYRWLAGALFVLLCVIALFVRDDLIRPYGGDVIVVVFLYFLLRGVTKFSGRVISIGVFGLALTIEAAQALRLIEIIGWEKYQLARVVLGSVADKGDVMAYGIGVILAVGVDGVLRRKFA